jgi:hypothetical protein
MRWRPTFMAEVTTTLQQLGLKTCPVCGSAKPLDMSCFPVLLVDGRFPPAVDVLAPGEHPGGDLTFAVRLECPTCGHLMLFDAQRYRTGDEKILVGDVIEDGDGQPGG